jgi:ribonuclease R
VQRAEGRPEERLIHYTALRSMRPARYDARCLGHFALAFDAYLHFTSPIRRYADLVVHRALRESRRHLDDDRRSELTEDMPTIARHTSERERRANEAERELVQWKKVRFMADKVGDEFEGYITGVSAFGLYLELIEHFVEGMVHVSTMADDYYRFVEKAHILRGETNGRVYRLGDRVRVQVIRVDLERRLIDLGLAEILDSVRRSQRPGEHRRGGPKPKQVERNAKRGRPGKRERAFKSAATRRRKR